MERGKVMREAHARGRKVLQYFAQFSPEQCVKGWRDAVNDRTAGSGASGRNTRCTLRARILHVPQVLEFGTQRACRMLSVAPA